MFVGAERAGPAFAPLRFGERRLGKRQAFRMHTFRTQRLRRSHALLLAIACAWPTAADLKVRTTTKAGQTPGVGQTLAAAQTADTQESRRSAADRHRQQGIVFLGEGNLQQASTEIRAALALDPDNAVSHDSMGVILGEWGQPDAAAAEFREAIRLDARLPEARLHLGLALERTGNTRDARAEYREALRLNPELLEARYGLSSVCASIGDRDGAIAMLRFVVKGLPQLADARYNLGLNLWNRYKHSAGLKHHEDLDEAVDQLKAAAQLQPREAALHFALGQLLAERQDLAPAVEQLQAALGLATGNPEYAYGLGLVLRLQADFDAAEAQFRAAIRTKPDHALARRALGLILRQKGDFDAAATELRRSIADARDDAQTHHILGTVLLKLNRPAEALDELREATRLDPSLVEARVILAQTLAKTGQREDARREQEAIQRVNAENADVGRTLMLLQTGSERAKKGDVEGAIAELREAVALSPSFPEAHYQLGVALQQSDADASEIETAFRRVLQLNPDHALARLQLGRVLAGRGDTGGAMAELREATALAPGLVEGYRALARLALEARNPNAAIRALQDVVIWKPDDADAHYDLAITLKAAGDLDEAARELAIAQRLKPARRIP
jgi:tetratricopeptide (TPR) repeat protein